MTTDLITCMFYIHCMQSEFPIHFRVLPTILLVLLVSTMTATNDCNSKRLIFIQYWNENSCLFSPCLVYINITYSGKNEFCWALWNAAKNLVKFDSFVVNGIIKITHASQLWCLFVFFLSFFLESTAGCELNFL